MGGLRSPSEGADGGDRAGPCIEGLRRGRAERRVGSEPRHRGRRVHRPGRPVGVWQDHRAPDGRRTRVDHRRHDLDRRPSGEHRAAEGTGHRDGVPELRAVSAHDRVRQHGVRAQAPEAARRTRSTAASARRREILGLEEFLERKPKALSGGQRQRVAMGRAIVREPQGVPDGRAAVEPRREAPRADALGDRADPARASTSPRSTSRTTRSRR